MPRFEQHLDAIPPKLRGKTAFYVGGDPKLTHLFEKPIPIEDVERLIPAEGGQRGAVVVTDDDGNPIYPWRYVALTEYDDDGNVLSVMM